MQLANFHGISLCGISCANRQPGNNLHLTVFAENEVGSPFELKYVYWLFAVLGVLKCNAAGLHHSTIPQIFSVMLLWQFKFCTADKVEKIPNFL